MRNPHLLADGWNKTVNGAKLDPLPVSVPPNKKFKRKSREPKRLYHSDTEPVVMKTFPPDYTADEDSAGETGAHEEPYGRLAAVQRHLMAPQEPGAARVPSGSSGHQHVSQSAAIDMRITSNVPGITAKLTQLPNPNRPSPFSQPQPESHKLGLHSSAFPSLAASAAGSHEHPSLLQPHLYSPDASLSARLGGGQVRGERAGASQTVYNGHMDELEDESLKESPRKRAVGVVGGAEPPPPGRVPEMKALQQTRRLLANARERTRVHTISAAFEALRKQVPCYSYGQKLSKLAILRIACNYILSLAQLAELDYSPDHSSGLSFSQCVEQCTRTLQAEGRSKKRKE